RLLALSALHAPGLSGAGRNARPVRRPSQARRLPGAAATAGASDHAGARGLVDREALAGLRVGHDRVTVDAGGRDLDLARRVAVGEAGVAAQTATAAAGTGVGVGVREAGLQLADHVSSVGLRARILSLV